MAADINICNIIRAFKSLPFGFERIFPDSDFTYRHGERVRPGEVFLSTVALAAAENYYREPVAIAQDIIFTRR